MKKENLKEVNDFIKYLGKLKRNENLIAMGTLKKFLSLEPQDQSLISMQLFGLSPMRGFGGISLLPRTIPHASATTKNTTTKTKEPEKVPEVVKVIRAEDKKTEDDTIPIYSPRASGVFKSISNPQKKYKK